MVVEGESKYTASVVITMPRQYRDYLTRKHNGHLLLAFGVYVSLCFIFYMLKWTTTGDGASVLFFALAIFDWIKQTRRKTWQYIIDEQHFHLIYWDSRLGKFWRWLDIEWKKAAVISVARDEWLGLPALRLTVDRKYMNDLIMVYALEDAEQVTSLVLPLIEKYRHQYRQKLWADTLRS